MRKRLHVRYPLLLSDFNEIEIFSADFRKKKAWRSNSNKIHPVRLELFRADEQTEGKTAMTNLIFTFRNFSKAAKNKRWIQKCFLWATRGSKTREHESNQDIRETLWISGVNTIHKLRKIMVKTLDVNISTGSESSSFNLNQRAKEGKR